MERTSNRKSADAEMTPVEEGGAVEYDHGDWAEEEEEKNEWDDFEIQDDSGVDGYMISSDSYSVPGLSRGKSACIEDRPVMIEEKDIKPTQERLIQEIGDTFGVSKGLARSLLIRYQWNSENLTNSFFDSSNLIAKLFNYEGVKDRMDPEQTYLCPVCYEEKERTMSLECGHRLCFDCYSDYLQSQFALGPDCIFTVCP
jgi:hypothetical protein